jgi:hypothetical protein
MVEENAATPCIGNERLLLVCALAEMLEGDEDEARRLERQSERHHMEGYGMVTGGPRLQLALQRGDLDRVRALLEEAWVRRSTWFHLSSLATRLDALAAIRERDRLESEATRIASGSTYLEPFALRALGLVRGDEQLVERAAERFAVLGLDWHSARTRDLL